jgi:propanediol dehydratase small subunit
MRIPMQRGDHRDQDLLYPIGENHPSQVRTASGIPLEEVTLEAVTEGRMQPGDLRITPEALKMQAQVAATHGRSQLVRNFKRAAELTSVPDGRLLEIYEALRPGRSSGQELEAIADELEGMFQAPQTAALVREAKAVYERRGILRFQSQSG